MAGELYNFLPLLSADIATEVTADIQRIIQLTVYYDQEKIKFSDLNSFTLDHDDSAIITASFDLKGLSSSTFGNIMDLFANSSKANGMENTFTFVSPNVWPFEAYKYTVRFWNPELEQLSEYDPGFGTITFKFEGFSAASAGTLQIGGADITIGGDTLEM